MRREDARVVEAAMSRGHIVRYNGTRISRVIIGYSNEDRTLEDVDLFIMTGRDYLVGKWLRPCDFTVEICVERPLFEDDGK